MKVRGRGAGAGTARPGDGGPLCFSGGKGTSPEQPCPRAASLRRLDIGPREVGQL